MSITAKLGTAIASISKVNFNDNNDIPQVIFNDKLVFQRAASFNMSLEYSIHSFAYPDTWTDGCLSHDYISYSMGVNYVKITPYNYSRISKIVITSVQLSPLTTRENAAYIGLNPLAGASMHTRNSTTLSQGVTYTWTSFISSYYIISKILKNTSESDCVPGILADSKGGNTWTMVITVIGTITTDTGETVTFTFIKEISYANMYITEDTDENLNKTLVSQVISVAF